MNGLEAVLGPRTGAVTAVSAVSTRATRSRRGSVTPPAYRVRAARGASSTGESAAGAPGHRSRVASVSDLTFRDRRPRRGRRRLPRRLGPAARGARRRRRRRAAGTVLLLEHPPVFTAGKRTDPHERPADPAARRSSTSTAAARSPSTAPASWSATRSCGCPTTCKVVDYVRRVEEALIAVCADLGVTTARVPGPQRRLAARGRPRPRAQDRRARHPGQPRRHHARVRAQLRRRPRLVRPVRARAASRDAGVTSLSRRARPRRHRSPRSLPLVERHLVDAARLGAVRRHAGLRAPPRARAARRASS